MSGDPIRNVAKTLHVGFLFIISLDDLFSIKCLEFVRRKAEISNLYFYFVKT